MKKTDIQFSNPGIVLGFIIVVINLSIYLQTLGFDFVWDDNQYLLINTHIHQGLTGAGIKWAFTIQNGLSYWHPMAFISHMLDFQLFGFNSAGHHLSNVIIHTANSILLFVVLRFMTKRLWLSFLVAALFSIHPINVESVAWVAERKNILSTFFFFLTILIYYRYTQKREVFLYILAIATFTLGLLAKPAIVSLPIILLIIDFWPLNRFKGNFNRAEFGRLIREKIPFVIMSCLSFLVTLLSVKNISQHAAGGDTNALYSAAVVPISLRISNALVSYVKYIGKYFFPSNLACYYPFPAAIPFWQTAGALLLLFFISYVCVRNIRQRPYLLAGWLWFCVTLLPASGIIQSGLWPEMADRWAYIPFIGLSIMTFWGISELVEKKNSYLLSIAFITCIAMAGYSTNYYLRFWQNEVTLYQHAIDSTTNNVFMKRNLSKVLANQGNYLQNDGKLDEAKDKFISAISIYPGNKDGYNGLGVNYMLRGKKSEAIENFQKALAIDQDYVLAIINLGIAYFNSNSPNQALVCFQKAVELDPSNKRALNSLNKITETINTQPR